MMNRRKFLHNKEFIKLWIGSCVSQLGDAMDNIVFMLLAIKITNSPVATSILMMSASLPNFIFSIFGGTVADLIKRKKIMVWTNVIRGLIIFSIMLLYMINKLNFFYLCISLFVTESISRFYLPAYQATIPNLVPREQYIQARSFTGSVSGIINMIGPSLSSILVSLFGFAFPLGFDSFSYFFAGLMASKTDVPERPDTMKGLKDIFNTTFLKKTQEGFVYLKKNLVLLKVFILFFFLNFLLGLTEVPLPFFIQNHLNLPLRYYGFIKTMAAAGFVIASLTLARIKQIKKPGRMMIVSVIFLGIFVVLFSYTRYFILNALFYGLAAYFRSIAALVMYSLNGLLVDDEYRGRVSGISNMIYVSTVPISMGLSGFIIELVPVQFIFTGIGIGFCLIGSAYLFDRNLFNYRLGSPTSTSA